MDRTALLDRYRRGAQKVMDALAGITPGELDRSPGGDSWTPRQVVHHLADSETTAYVRLRKLLAEENPLLQGYDEVEFAQRLHYDRPIESSLAVLRAVRQASAELLESLELDEWGRVGTHSESVHIRSTGGWRSTPTTPRSTPTRSEGLAEESADHAGVT